MRLHNTLTGQSEAVTATKPGAITVYSCGPTVYDHAHIGNLRTFIMDDLTRRTILATGNEMIAVMNITDIDDKTIARGKEEHPDMDPMEALIASTRAYEEIFMDDLEAVGVDVDEVTFVRATDSIGQMQALIIDIQRRGFAYISEGSVYFDLAKYRAAGNTYGRLSNVDYSAQARIDNDEYEKNEARDFVLWKGRKDGEPFWEFDLNGTALPGRPGWHIECSAMAIANLGQPLAVHTGGIDLKFPHHENEIAQAVAGTGDEFVRIFVHHNHLYVDGRKMSKSLKNFYTVNDIVAKGFHPLSFRLLALQAHHTSELNFTWASLDAAEAALLKLYAWADRTHQDEPTLDASAADQLVLALADNLDSPKAIAELFQLDGGIPSPDLLARLDEVLGLHLADRLDATDEQKQLMKQREAARQAKDFDASDEIRAQLLKLFIEVDDTPAGPRWRRTVI